jgi:hypothetical protein
VDMAKMKHPAVSELLFTWKYKTDQNFSFDVSKTTENKMSKKVIKHLNKRKVEDLP